MDLLSGLVLFLTCLGAFSFWVHRRYLTHAEPPRSKLIPDPEPGKEPDYDILVIGAGVAGASLGAALARLPKREHPYRVGIVERNLGEVNRIVGELLQPGGVEQLEKLGIADALEGFDAQPVRGYHIEYTSAPTPQPPCKLLYPYKDKDRKARHTGRGFHNEKFCTALRNIAKSSPDIQLIEGDVTHLLETEGRVTGFRCRIAGETRELRAPLTVVCEGVFSSFRKSMHCVRPETLSYFLGVVLKDCELPTPNRGTVVLSNPTPMLLYPISSTETRLLIDFPDQIPSKEQLPDVLRTRVLPQIPEPSRPSFERFLESGVQGKVLSMPNRSLSARPVKIPGAILLGDALNVRHPLTGGGMTVALTDVRLLVERLRMMDPKDFRDPETVKEFGDFFYRERTRDNATINILADALYNVFIEKHPLLRHSCFTYLSLGGKFASGPTELLSGVSRSQILLFTHYFTVALFALSQQLLPFPGPGSLVRGVRLMRNAFRVMLPLIVRENPILPVAVICELLKIMLCAY